MNNKLLFIPQWHTAGTISTPDTNYKALYPKANDNHWYFVDSDGSEKRIETALDIRNGITTTNYSTSSVFRSRLDVALGLGLTFSGNFAGSTISVFNVTTDMLKSLNTATAGYVLTSNGSSFQWVPTASVGSSINGTTNKLAKFNSTTTIGNSLITDDGVKLVIGVTPSFAVGVLNVDGSMYLSGYLYLTDSLNSYIRHSNGLEVQTDKDIIFRDELGYNYLDMKTDNISSYTFSIMESTIIIGDNGTYSYILSEDVDRVDFGVTNSTLTFSIFSNTPGVLRLKDSSEGANKVFVSDSEGYGRWQNLRAGNGMTVSGITYSVRLGGTGLTFSSNALTFDYSILGSTLTQSSGVINLSSSGVTPGVYGTAGNLVRLTVDTYGRVTNVSLFTQSVVTAANGLSITAGTVSLGGTLSRNTTINANLFDFIVSSASNYLVNTSTFDIESDFMSLDAGTGSVQILADDNITISGLNSVDLITSGVLDIAFTQSTITDNGIGRGLVYASNYAGTFVSNSLVNKAYVDSVSSGPSYGNGIGLTGGAVVLGGTLSQPTIIDVATQSLALVSIIDLNIPHFYGLVVENNVSQLGYTNQGSTSSIVFVSIDAVSMITSDGSNQFSLSLDQSVNQALFYDTFNSKGLEYGGSYSGNFTTYSLVDKFYVDTELSSFLPLSGGTLSGNLEINGTTSNTLTLYSSGTGSTIFRVQGTSGELFSVVDGLTGSLFSVNNISGLPILEVFSDDTILMGDYVAPSLNSTFKVTTVTGSNTIYSIDKSLYTGAFFEYTVTKGTNARAGSIMSVWNGLTASYTETSTTDIGLTTDIIFLVSSTGSNAILTASASSNNWIIKTIVRSI